jgi:hypothetical protein
MAAGFVPGEAVWLPEGEAPHDEPHLGSAAFPSVIGALRMDFTDAIPVPGLCPRRTRLAVAGRVAGASDREARLLARIGTKNYRRHLGQLTSMPAPVASGWSGCRVGLAPTGKRRLVTAHTLSGHLMS